MISHIVLFEPKTGLSDAQRQEFLSTIQLAIGAIPEVRRARIGKIFSLGVMPDNIMGGTTHSFAAVFEFVDRRALQTYLDHPAHQAVRRLFWEHCASTLIADTEMTDVSVVSSSIWAND